MRLAQRQCCWFVRVGACPHRDKTVARTDGYALRYKDYVLVLLFMNYASDKASSQKGYLLDVPRAAASPTWSR